MQPYHREMLANGHRFGPPRAVQNMLYPPPHALPPPPNFLPPRLPRFAGPPPPGSPMDVYPHGLPPPSGAQNPQLFQGVTGPPPPLHAPPGMVVLPPRRETLPPPPVHLALPPPRSLPPPPVAQRGVIPDLRSPPPSLRFPDWVRPPEAVSAQMQPPLGTIIHRQPVSSVALQQPPPAGSTIHITGLPPPHSVQSVYPSHNMPPPTMVLGPATHVNPAFMAPSVTLAAPPVSVAVVSQPMPIYTDPYIRPAMISSSGNYYTTELYSAQPVQPPREHRAVQPTYERSERTSASGSSSSAAATASASSQSRYLVSERVTRRARSPERESVASVKLSEREFDDILQRNKSVSSGAIMRAVQDASAGEFASAIETLVTAISLIKQSRIANDDRCKILISSLQDTLHGIESKSYGSKSLSSRSTERHSSNDYDKVVSSRTSSAVRNRSRSPRDHEIRSREYSRSSVVEPRGASREPDPPRLREYSRNAVLETTRISSREEEPRSRDYSRAVVAEPSRGASREQDTRSRDYRRVAGESRALSTEKERYYEPVPVPAAVLERASRSDRSERPDRERERVVVPERDVERSHRSDRTEREYPERIEREAERVPRERASERASERDVERSRDRPVERVERDYSEREPERVRERATERDYSDRADRDYLERDGERHRERVSERDYADRPERERERADRDRDYGIRSSRHYSSQKHSQM